MTGEAVTKSQPLISTQCLIPYLRAGVTCFYKALELRTDFTF